MTPLLHHYATAPIRNISTAIAAKIAMIIIASISHTAHGHSKFIEHSGDAIQIAAPIVACLIASDEKGAGHFAATFGTAIGSSLTIKGIGMLAEPDLGRRPRRSANRKTRRYDGFPSGHTTSAFAAASYVQHYGGKWRGACVPLYISAAFTGFSRVHSKWHTATQVAGGIMLAEVVMYFSAQTEWSKKYQATPVFWGDKNGINARLVINF